MNPTRSFGKQGIATAGEALALLLLSPLAISFTSHTPLWDELFFFHHAACLRNAVQLQSWAMGDGCMRAMTKSPILALMLLPAASLHGTESLAVAPITLSLLCFALLWLALRMVQRGGVSLPIVVAASGIAILAPPLTAGAPFLVDELTSIVILDTLLLVLLETGAPGTTNRDAIRRGLLWGLLFTIGVLSKLTYFYFAGVTFTVLTLLSWRLCGVRLTAMKLAAMAVVCLFPGAVYARYGMVYWNWAMSAAFGPIAVLFNDHIQRWAFIRISFASLGWMYWIGILALFAVSAWIGWRSRQRGGMLNCLGLIAIVAGYLFIASGSPNKDPRFFWPVWLALPFCAAAAGARLPAPEPSALRGIGLLPLSLIVLLSVVTSGRFNMRAVSEAELILQSLPHNRPIKVILAMDEGAFNIETFILARQLDINALQNIDLDTVVYDFVAKRTVADSIHRLLSANYVILRDPVNGSAPPWANQFLPQFAAAVEAKDRLFETFPGREVTRIYAMH